MSINKRINLLRKHLGMIQQDFADKIGVKRVTISWMEKEGNTITRQNIKIICDTFNVNENWLLTGEGDMFRPAIEPCIMDKLKKELNLTPEEVDVVRTFVNLTPEQRKIAIEFVRDFASKFSDVINAFKKGTKKDVSDSDTPSMDNHARNANAADTGAALPPSTAPSDTSRPAGLSDEEWQLVQMSREEKEQASPTSSATSSAIG